MMTPQAQNTEQTDFDAARNIPFFDVDAFQDTAQEIEAPANDPVAPTKYRPSLLTRRSKRWQRMQNRR